MVSAYHSFSYLLSHGLAFGACELTDGRKSGRYAGSVASLYGFAYLNLEKAIIPGTFLYLLVERGLNFAIDMKYLNCKCF